MEATPFTNFVGALQEDERRVNDLEAGLSPIVLRLSTFELKRRTRLLDPHVTPGEEDTLLNSAYPLGKLGDDLTIAANQA